MSLRRQEVLLRLRQAARRGAEDALEELAAEARRRTPADTGRLRASCRTEADETGGAVWYTAPYAAARHERQPGGKFLESACYDPGVRARMAQALARRFREEMR